MDNATKQLEVNNIEVVYNDIVQVLRGVSLSVPDGSIVALLGKQKEEERRKTESQKEETKERKKTEKRNSLTLG